MKLLKELEATEETLAHLICGNCNHYFEEHYEDGCFHDEHLKIAIDKYIYKCCFCKKFVIPEVVILDERKEAA